LTVVYQERFSAAGRTSSGFQKREGKPRDSEVLVSRLVDRPLRPAFAEGFFCETQILQLVLAWDGARSPDALAITAAGAAAAVSDVPLTKPVAGVRVAWLGGAPLVNPTLAQMADSRLDLVLAGTRDAILMIEGYGDFLEDSEMLLAIEAGHAAVRTICVAVELWAAKVGKPKIGALTKPPPGLKAAVLHLAEADITTAFRTIAKQERGHALHAIQLRLHAALSPEYSSSEVNAALKSAQKDIMRALLRTERLRSDGRTPEAVRAISAEARLLPRVHGSSLFTRGETQAIAVVTLGGVSDAQRVDDMMSSGENRRLFSLSYYFPPSCVGEVGRVGAPSRRELGHGNLAERALAPALPNYHDFPYVIRVESTITESNGSSSMASVCAGCIALQDAGVPIKRMVAGVAMGLLLPAAAGDKAIILTDIMGSEECVSANALHMSFAAASSLLPSPFSPVHWAIWTSRLRVMQRELQPFKWISSVRASHSTFSETRWPLQKQGANTFWDAWPRRSLHQAARCHHMPPASAACASIPARRAWSLALVEKGEPNP
jgi:polyribonucleotide nucleotidyltransferase